MTYRYLAEFPVKAESGNSRPIGKAMAKKIWPRAGDELADFFTVVGEWKRQRERPLRGHVKAGHLASDPDIPKGPLHP
jgi:hypothetical protein